MGPQHYVIGNWKMNGLVAGACALAQTVLAGARGCATQLALCPPATSLGAVSAVLGRGPVMLGGQDCHPKASGAHTGDVSAEMLADVGCGLVVVGHSERRTNHGERDDLVRAKAEAAHRAGLVAVICVGETLAEREAGRTREILATQLHGSVSAGATATRTIIAYEPVWAIGTGKVASPAQAAEAHGWIRSELDTMTGAGGTFSILYGGSVKPENAADLFALPGVDGALVGGASLDATQFLAIAAAAPRRGG
jgi:triosephosphate isomerase